MDSDNASIDIDINKLERVGKVYDLDVNVQVVQKMGHMGHILQVWACESIIIIHAMIVPVSIIVVQILFVYLRYARG